MEGISEKKKGMGATHPALLALALVAAAAAMYFAVFPDDAARIADSIADNAARLGGDFARSVPEDGPEVATAFFGLIGNIALGFASYAEAHIGFSACGAALLGRATGPGRAILAVASAACAASLALEFRLAFEVFAAGAIDAGAVDARAGIFLVLTPPCCALVAFLRIALEADASSELGPIDRALRAAVCAMASLGDVEKPMLLRMLPEEAIDLDRPYEGYALLEDLRGKECRIGRATDAYGRTNGPCSTTRYQRLVAKRLSADLKPAGGNADKADEILLEAQRRAGWASKSETTRGASEANCIEEEGDQLYGVKGKTMRN